jgi:cystathionine beta-lyase family protein involved in aluminum resistance
MINIEHVAVRAEKMLKDRFIKADRIRYQNQIKVLEAMRRERLSETDFNYSSGYGYGDNGRDKLDRIFTRVFETEDALVRHQFVSGTHAISTALFANLKSKDLLLSVYGHPYDTLQEVIGISGTGKGSLIEAGIKYDHVEIEDHEKALIKKLALFPKVCFIQRSRGYAKRTSLDIDKIAGIISIIKEHSPGSVIIVDNCYGEFVEDREPSQVGADLIAGSLIKNPGGGLAPCGGYIAGKREYVENCEYRMTCPGLGRKVGPSLGHTREIAMGLFFAPHVVSESLKGAIFCAAMAELLGFEAFPGSSEKRTDIVQAIGFKDQETMVSFCRSIQKYSPVDSFVVPFPWDMPGYESKVIMAAGTFTSGSSIELSCDAPIREPYTAYFQGGLFYDHARYALLKAFEEMNK